MTKTFDKSQLMPDPLQFPHLFKEEKDIEVMAFIASVFAYGNVKQIINSLNKFLLVCGNQPYEFIKNYSTNYSQLQKSFVHRFYTSQDVTQLFHLLHLAYQEFGRLKKLFLSGYNQDDINVKNAITNFSNLFLEKTKRRIWEDINWNEIYVSLTKKGKCLQTNKFISPLDGKKR